MIFQLLPGFVAAEIIYLLTSYLKPAPFERVVQALVLTVLVRGAVFITGCFVCSENQFLSENGEYVVSVLYAIVLGVLLSLCINNDFPNRILRLFPKIVLTRKTLHPSEWFSFFSKADYKLITLHLEGERRIAGFVEQYPDDSTNGYFILRYPGWVDKRGNINYLKDTDKILISVKEVVRVEMSRKEYK